MADSRQGADSTVVSYTFDEPLHISSLQPSRELSARVVVGRCSPASKCSCLSHAVLPAEDVLGACNLLISSASKCCYSFRGQPVAVKVVEAAEHAAIQREVKAYERMGSLQGIVVPRLKAHGFTLGGAAYFLATELLDVSQFLRCPMVDSTCRASLAVHQHLRCAIQLAIISGAGCPTHVDRSLLCHNAHCINTLLNRW